MVTCFIMFFIYNTINFSKIGYNRFFFYSAITLFLIGDVLLNRSNSLIFDILKVSDSGRGLGSGLSGRDDLWFFFLPQFLESPVIGYGFRSRASYIGSHNGFLDIILQQGVIGSFLFFSYLLVFLWRSALDVFNKSRKEYRGAVLSILLGLIFGAQLQPQFFSFGDPFGVLTLVCLFARRGFEYDDASAPSGDVSSSEDGVSTLVGRRK